MDPNSVAIEPDIAFGFQTAAEVPVFQVPAADVPLDRSAADLDLCRMAEAGNIAAFELLYERYHRRTYSLCLRMTSSQTEAEDLTQEVFIQLFRKIGSFRGDSAFSTWLHRLTVNQVLADRFGVAIIPHTRERTIIGGYRPGTIVNLEADLLARYLRSLLAPGWDAV